MGHTTADVTAQPVWAPADFPYQCLIDARRTEAFRTAIRASVRPGDVVVIASRTSRQIGAAGLVGVPVPWVPVDGIVSRPASYRQSVSVG